MPSVENKNEGIKTRQHAASADLSQAFNKSRARQNTSSPVQTSVTYWQYQAQIHMTEPERNAKQQIDNENNWWAKTGAKQEVQAK